MSVDVISGISMDIEGILGDIEGISGGSCDIVSVRKVVEMMYKYIVGCSTSFRP